MTGGLLERRGVARILAGSQTGGTALPSKALGRLYVAFTVLAVVAVVTGPTAEAGPASRSTAATVAGLDAVLATVCLWLPWQRWPASRCLFLAAPTVAVLGYCTGTGMLPPRTPPLMFTLLFVWIGSYFPRGSSLPVAPAALLSYLLGMRAHSGGTPGVSAAAVLLVGVWVLVAEIIAARTAQLQTTLSDSRFLLDNTSDLIMRLDERSIMRYVSPSVTILLGWRPEEMIGRPAAEFRHPDDPGSVPSR